MQMLIAIDGPEGAGKTTQVNMLVDSLAQLGYNVMKIREPGGTILGEQLRALLLNPESKIDVKAEVMLFMASRAQMYVEKIIPALAQGKVIIMDRWAWSTYAYQHDLTIDEFKNMTQFATKNRYPEVSFILDVPIETGMHRLDTKTEQSFGGGRDRFEQRSRQFHESVRNRYLDLAHIFRLDIVDTLPNVQSVHEEIFRKLPL
jgi:dTMP kinase